MKQITLIAPQKSNRLRYVCDWLFVEILGLNYSIVASSENDCESDWLIYYGVETQTGFSVPDCGLLWENSFSKKELAVGSWENIPTLFHCEKSGSIPFDLFNAVFYLLSRFEEYLPYTADKHKRFPHSESVLYKIGWLQRPLIDEWVIQFKKSLEKHFKCYLPAPAFSFSPTYDIDIAYSYQHKGFVRWCGAVAKELLTRTFSSLASRITVLLGVSKDPFDCFEELEKTHKQLNLSPTFFILVAEKISAFDKNNLPSNSAMKKLIVSLSKQGKIGLHPSYFSQEKNNLEEEKSVLENIINKPIAASRQHYIRLQIPQTYQLLIEKGIAEDFSMGYGAALGFRAGTGRSFFWFDLEKNEQTSLRIHPFCFMDSTAHYEEKMSAAEAEKVLLEMLYVLQQTNSQMITVFHNFSLGTAKEWNGWRETYFSFLEKAKQ